jgi:hypothetical protein
MAEPGTPAGFGPYAHDSEAHEDDGLRRVRESQDTHPSRPRGIANPLGP